MRAGTREHSDDIACPSMHLFPTGSRRMPRRHLDVAIWTGVTWRAVALAMMLYVLRVFATGAGHRRYFTHRAFGTSRICQFASGFCQPRHAPRNFASEPAPPADGIGRRQVVGADAPVGASRKVSPGAALLRQRKENGGVRITVGDGRGRIKRTAIVALARKLLVALWRFVTQGIVPESAALKAAKAA
jgi:hypothetical protein